MHLEVYRNRPDVRAVVHAHPPMATGFAVAGIPLDRAVLAEVITTLGSIPIAEYATPSTEELPAAVRKYVKAHDGLLLANHGALTLAGDVFVGVLQDGDHRALRARSAWWRARWAASTCSRATRWTGCRGCAACTASRRRRRSAPTTRPTAAAASAIARWCRRPIRRPSGWCPTARPPATGTDGEIRLTYRELTALIEDAVE